MKICPNCQQHYEDDGLNFCLNDGGVLEIKDDDAPPPTMMMPQTRQTNPNVGNDFTTPTWQKEQPQPSTPWQSAPTPQTPPISPWQSAPMQPQSPMSPQANAPNYMSPPVYASGGIDQNLPVASIICGSTAILSLILCCGLGPVFGFPLGIAAAVTGFMGMNNANQNPQKYGGKNLAIGGMTLGGVSLLISVGVLLFLFIVR